MQRSAKREKGGGAVLATLGITGAGGGAILAVLANTGRGHGAVLAKFST